MQEKALDAMQKGITILGRTAGTHDSRYAIAEIRYAKLLRAAGQRPVAASLKKQGEATLRDIQRSECADCTMDVAAFR